MDWKSERNELIETVCTMNKLGINHGTSGNASVRVDNGYLMTPSGVAYEEMREEDIVLMSFDGSYESIEDRRKPSSEWRFHQDLLSARADFGAILHTHGTAATTLACHRREIPPFHYMIALAGGHTIRCAEYATFGTQALSDNVLTAMEGRKACLMANHGLLVGEASLRNALSLAVEVEYLCDAYWRALQLGDPVLLTTEQMDAAQENFRKGYGIASP
ncbi:class II aldolase/adducin family protein [Sneathiella marina]|uniref:Class II aldolase/adducin family protein n=1 Tax=Sneathiella marina TaxID=2950108 RepID=A0ABY4W7H8_9PROT|nr:class II aldolase/adducin family protein [Sneathiella marina]USG62977.1 class II aldolase/adducin family protein [Sneathiella marina]